MCRAYVPGGVSGASRDLALLLRAPGITEVGTGNLLFARNNGPATQPRFSAFIEALDVPDARRLHYLPSFPIAPGQPGYLAYPLIASTGDERLWVVVIGEDGSVTRQSAALLHPGGAADVLVFREPNASKPAFISLGASPALLWLQAGDGSYSSQPLNLPGLGAGDQVVKGVMAQFQLNDTHPDLVLALADGHVLRWDGAGPVGPGMPMSFGPAQPVATGLTVHNMAELGVQYRDALLNSRRRSGIMIAAQPESRFYDTDPTQAAFPFQPTPRNYAAARSVAGDFGLDTAYLGRIDRGVLILQYDESAPPVPNRIGWTDTFPLALFGDGAAVGTLIDLTSDGARDSETRVEIAAGDAGGSCSSVTNEITAPPGERNFFKLSPLIIPTTFGQEFQLCLQSANGSVIRGPFQRPVYRVTSFCPGQCVVNCLNAARPPASKGQAGKALVDALGLTTLTRFRDEVLVDSSKGRDYAAIYREYSADIYRAVVTTPYALRDIERARDAWLPAITAWVNGDRSTVINQTMLDTLDVLAQHLMTLGSTALADVVREEYRQLDPPSLLNATISTLEARYETLKPRLVMRDGFENPTPSKR